MDRYTVKTACHACHGGCGALVTMENGIPVDIRPDPDAPLSKGRLCPKGYAGIELMNDPRRLKYPMKRIGERGEGKWQRISWDEAYDLTAKGIQGIIDKYGAESILMAQGTGRRTSMHVCRFNNVIGSPNWIEPGTAQCWFPRVTTGNLTFGSAMIVDYYGDVRPECILVWGSNPTVSGADGELQFHIRDCMKAGTKLIVVDPRRTELAAKADIWLQIRPGTDAALALGMMNIMIEENLCDTEFIDKWCYGFEELKARCAEYPAEKVAELTWLSADQIRAAARMFAESRPGALEWGCAIEHTPNCLQTVRAVALIMALTGNFDVPGGMIEGMKILPGCDPLDRVLSEEQSLKRFGEKEYPLFAAHGNNVPNTHIPSVFNAAASGEPYPVKGLLLFGNNGVISFADSKKTYDVYKNMEFCCCMDLFMTPSAELADIVLPAAGWLEAETVFSMPFQGGHVVLAQKKLTQVGECKQDEEVFVELAKRLGLDYHADSIYDIFEEQLRGMGERRPELKGIDYKKIQEMSYLSVPIEYRKYEKRGKFATPTGKCELYSTRLAELGIDPLPYYKEPPESPYSRPDLLGEFPLVLTTGGRQHPFFISEGRQVPRLRNSEPFPRVEIHPDTAAKYGISDGDWVFIESPRGKITQKAKLTDGIDPRVVNCQMGWWYPEDPSPEHGCFESNANVLTSQDPPYDPAIGTYQLRALLCRIYPNPDCSIEERYRASDIYKEALAAEWRLRKPSAKE